MMTVRGITRRFLNAVMALHRRAIIREVSAQTKALRLAERRVASQERVIEAEKAMHWRLRDEAVQAYTNLVDLQNEADAELDSLPPRN